MLEEVRVSGSKSSFAHSIQLWLSAQNNQQAINTSIAEKSRSENGEVVGLLTDVALDALYPSPDLFSSTAGGKGGTTGVKVGVIGDGAKEISKLPVPNDLPTKIHMGQQGKHIKGHNNFEEGRSYFNDGVDPTELLGGVHSGKYPVVGAGARGNPIVDFGRPIGIDGRTGQSVTRGQIHYGKNGAHIVPDARN